MDSSLWTRRVLTGLVVCVALTVAATVPAWAGEDETSDKDGTHRGHMHVVVKKGDQDGKVQVLELKDGKWVGSDSAGAVEHAERRVILRREPAVKTTFGLQAQGKNPMSTVMRWLMTDGVAGELPNDPVQAWFDGGAEVPLAGLRDALKADGWTAKSLQRWFVGHLMGAMTAMHAPTPAHPVHAGAPARGHWFEIGRCRSCDGDCGARNQAPRRGGDHGRRHGRNFRRGHHGGRDCDGGRRSARQSCRGDCGSCKQRSSCSGDCGSCDKRRSCCGDCGSCSKCGACGGDCGSCDQRGACNQRGAKKSGCGGDCDSCDKRGACGQRGAKKGDCNGGCGQKGRGPAKRQAFMVWNDGSGWKQRPVDAQGPVAGWIPGHGPAKGMTFHGEGSEAPPELHVFLETLLGESQPAPRNLQALSKGLDLLPPELLDQIPPEVLEGVLKELNGLGLGDLLPPAKDKCRDCPKKGECAGACDDGAEKSAKSGDCCGTCKGDCADCPKAKDGSCAGNCEDCPSKKAAEKK